MNSARVIAKLEEIHGAATPGEWVADKHTVHTGHYPQSDIVSYAGLRAVDDARAIAAAHNANPALLKIAKAAERLIVVDEEDRKAAGVYWECESTPEPSEEVAAIRAALAELAKVKVGGG